MKSIYLVTELYKPIGGLHRYSTNLLNAWRKLLQNNETNIEPFVISVKSQDTPIRDLKQSQEYKDFIDQNDGINIFEAERAGVKCYFLEGSVPELGDFHYDMWEKYGIDSSNTSPNFEWYNKALSTFWYWAPRFAKHVQETKDVKFKCVDAQDWLSFPAGFYARDMLDIPLVCRIHSGEYGRSLGSPNYEDAPIQIETAALQFADYIQGVSISETTFQINNLLPFKEKLDERLKERKSESWYRYQNYRNEKIKSFLLYESEEELVLLKDLIGGMGNGIELDGWKDITKKDIKKGRKRLNRLMPQKDNYIFFIGRPEYRKGLDFLLDAVSIHNDDYEDTGLIIASTMHEKQYREYHHKIEDMDIEDDVYILDQWLEPKEKKRLFCASDVIALPSVYEPFGIVALEGLAADYAAERNNMTGPVVVAGNTGGMDEIITSGVNGFEVPIHNFSIDVDILNNALQEALDEDKRKKISRNGAQRVQSKYFNWEYIFKNVLRIYNKAEENWKKRKKYVNEHSEN